jgi:hypothetical protein
MSHRIRLSEAAFAPLEVYVLDVAHLEGPDEDEAATCREIADAVVRLPNGGAVLHLPGADDEARLWRWHAVVAAGAESAHESGHHSWERSLAATASKVLEPLRERERAGRMRENPDEPDEPASENWPISKIDPPANERGNVSHRAWHEALKAAGWVSSNERPDLFAAGDTALVSMDNGHEAWATITRFYKNGAVGVIQNGERLNAREVWKQLAAPKKNPRRNPRQTYPDGRLIPVLGDEVYQQVRGFMGAGGAIRGVVVKGRGGALRVKLTGYSGMMPTTDVVEGKTMPLTPAWTVVDDPIHDVRKVEAKKAIDSKEEIQRQAKEAVEHYVQQHGLIPASMDNITVGMTLVMPYSEGQWGTGDPQRIHVEEVTVEEIESRGFVYDGGRTSPLKGWYVAGARPMRENKGNQRFIRRAPVATRTGSAKRERRFRYTYDADEAARTALPARIGEKLRIPHKGQPGHYEVVERLAPDVVGVLHDETGHAMAISDTALRELVRDFYRPAEGTAPTEDDRHRHEREDALPRSRYEALKAIIDASGIDDHDFAAADAAYHAWKTAGTKKEKAKIEGKPTKKAKGKQAKAKRGPRVKRPPKPPPWEGGQLDAFEGDLRRDARGRVRHFTSLLEAFEHASRGARTWRDLTPALALLRDVKGFEEARFPDEVYERHNRHEAELEEQGHTIDVDLYGVPVTLGTDLNEAIFLASSLTPPGLLAPLSEEDEARAAREEEGEYEDDFGDLWA